MAVEDPRAALLDAARAAFAASGYARSTLKGVAAAAGVAPTVLKQYYDNKEQLFAAMLRLPYDPASAVPALLAPGVDGLGERLVRLTFATLGDDEVRANLESLVRAGSAAGRAAPDLGRVLGSLTEYIELSLLDRVVNAIGLPDARMRGALIASYLIGIGAGRYVVKIPPLDSADEDSVVRMVAPTIQALLDPTVPLLPGDAGDGSDATGGRG